MGVEVPTKRVKDEILSGVKKKCFVKVPTKVTKSWNKSGLEEGLFCKVPDKNGENRVLVGGSCWKSGGKKVF